MNVEFTEEEFQMVIEGLLETIQRKKWFKRDEHAETMLCERLIKMQKEEWGE